MAVEFGTFPRQEGLGELLSDLVQVANRPGVWAKMDNHLTRSGPRERFPSRLRRMRVLELDLEKFECMTVNDEVWIRYTGNPRTT